MSAEDFQPQCVGVCIVDPESGTCLGCGRVAEHISGVAPPRPLPAPPGPAPLPANVAAEVGGGSE